MKNNEEKKITITRYEFRKAFMNYLENPFSEKEDTWMSSEQRSQLQFQIMINGMVILRAIEERLFGE